MSSMVNIIKMDLFRLVKARGTYITLAFVAVVTCMLFMMSVSFGEAAEAEALEEGNVMWHEVNDEEIDAIKGGDGMGFYMPDFTRDSRIPFETLINGFLSSGVFLVFVGIFATNTVCNQYHCGFQKNLSIYSRKKWQLVIAQNIVILVFCVVEILLTALTVLLLSRCYLHHFTWGDIGSIVRYMGIHILMHYAFGIFVMCLAELIRSKVAGITLTCLLSLGFGSLFFHKLDELLKLKKFSVTEHTLVYHVKLLPISYDSQLWGKAITVAISAILLYNVISALVVSKRDMA